MTDTQFRRMALALPGTVENEHMGHPDFRAGGRIFATLHSPKPGFAMVGLTPEEQAAFVGAHPETFVPVKGGWGLKGATNVVLSKAHVESVRDALECAWRRRVEAKAPKRKTKPSEAKPKNVKPKKAAPGKRA